MVFIRDTRKFKMIQSHPEQFMRICLVSKEYPPETGWGGIGTYTCELAHGLASLGHEVHVIAGTSDEEKEYKDGPVFIHRIKQRNIFALWRLEKIFPMVMLFYSLRVSQKIHELVDRFHIDIVEAPEWRAEAFWYSFNKKVPLFIKFHTPLFVTEKLNHTKRTLKNEIIKFLEKRASTNADYYSAPSHQMAEIIADIYKINLPEIKVLPLPINTDSFKPAQDGAAQNERIVLYVGRFEVRKGILVLADAIFQIQSQMPDVKFIFIGKDIYSIEHKTFLKKFIVNKSKYPSKITFIDHMDRDKVIEYYTKSSVSVVPSIWENFGYTVLESMACGTPVVTTDKAGITEYLDQSGVVKVPAENSQKLADAILDVLLNDEVRLKSRTKARYAAEKLFSRAVVSHQYEMYFKSIFCEKEVRKKEVIKSGGITTQ